MLANSQTRDQEVSDSDLVSRIAAQDQGALELLMRRYNQTLYRTARSILRDDAEAEDVLQEAYLLIFRGIHKFRGDAKLSTWLTRVVVNEAIAKARKHTRRANVIALQGDSPLDEESVEGNEIMPRNAPESPEQAAARAQIRQLIEKKIDQLPSAFRTVFVLRALEEMTGEEVAACLNIPEATVRSRFFRARSLLRDALTSEIDFALEDAFAFAGGRCDRIVGKVLQRIRLLSTQAQPDLLPQPPQGT